MLCMVERQVCDVCVCFFCCGSNIPVIFGVFPVASDRKYGNPSRVPEWKQKTPESSGFCNKCWIWGWCLLTNQTCPKKLSYVWLRSNLMDWWNSAPLADQRCRLTVPIRSKKPWKTLILVGLYTNMGILTSCGNISKKSIQSMSLASFDLDRTNTAGWWCHWA